MYDLDANCRQVVSHRPTTLRYEDLHPAADPAEVYEAPDGQWAVRTVPHVLEPERTPTYDSFDSYIRTLPPWETDILQHVTLDLDPAYLSFDLQIYFYAGSDGSVKHNTNGSFGWIVANTEGHRVASANGPARCAKMDSYRAECTGMLSLLRFLIRLALYTNMDKPWRGLVGTDSQSMIDRLYVAGIHNHTKQLATLDVLDAEWDVLIEIQDALRELPGVDITYVKGHQDDRVPYAQLPLLARLNVDADRLAGDYHRDHGARRPFAFMAPSTGAFLVTDDGTLTSDFSSELRSRSTSPGLEEYMRTKNNWDYCTFDKVNWVTHHGKAVKAFRTKRVHLTKFLHDALPTFHHANLMDGGTRKCIGCGSCDETSDHIFRCAAPSRADWRQHWWQSMDEFHETHATHPLLRHVFREAMTQWFHPDSPDTVSPILFPPDARSLILSQNAIGWRQIFRGRFSREWQRIQNDNYMKHKHKSKYKRTGNRWQQQLITTVWENWFELWAIRNGEVHGTTETSRAQAQRREVDRQLVEIYASRVFMEEETQVLLEPDQAAHAQRPTHVNKNWLAMAGPVIRSSVRRMKRVSLQGVRSLRSYFPRTGDG